MTATTTVTLAELTERLKATPWPHTFTVDGIPVWEIGDEGEWLMTLGHVDKTAFAKAYDAYLEEVCGDDRLGQCFTIEEFVSEAEYRKARIARLEEFPLGEFEVVLDKAGDVDVTVRDNI